MSRIPPVALMGFLAACGGGGGSSIAPTPTPTVTLSANPTTVNSGQTTALTWSSTNATSCTASGAWSGTKATSGTETSAALTANATFTLTCSGTGGSGSQSVNVTVNAPPATVTVSGKVEYDAPTTDTDGRLNYLVTTRKPVRLASVQIIGANGTSIVASTSTDNAGNYSVSASPGGSLTVRVRAAASGTNYDFRVVDNTQGNALYAITSSSVTPSSATVTVNLVAPTGWTGTTADNGSFTGTRAAAPFAILDVALQMRDLVRGADASASFGLLNFYWSTLNRDTSPTNTDCIAEPSTGKIGTTFFLGIDVAATATCPAVPAGAYVLGDDATDADEFDASVMAHELAHYYEDDFSRSESMGGPHGLADREDLRLAFSEGWGNAFSGMVLNSSVYRDRSGPSGRATAFSFDMESDSNPYSGETGNVTTEGFFSESSVMQLIWDVYDGANEGNDTVSLGFTPIHNVMSGSFRNSTALASIYVLFDGLISGNAGSAAGLRSLLTSEGIFGTGEFASGETNFSTDPFGSPLYNTVTFGTPRSVVSVNRFNDDDFYESFNRLGARRFFRLTTGAGPNYRIQVTGPNGSDPDFYLYRRGQPVCSGESFGQEDMTCTGLTPSADFVLEVYECSNLGDLCVGDSTAPRGDTTLTVTVTQQ